MRLRDVSTSWKSAGPVLAAQSVRGGIVPDRWYLHRTISLYNWYDVKVWFFKVTGPFGTQAYSLVSNNYLTDVDKVREWLAEHHPRWVQDVTNPDLWGLN